MAPEEEDSPPRGSRSSPRRPAGPPVIPLRGTSRTNRPMRPSSSAIPITPSPLGQNSYAPRGAPRTAPNRATRQHMGMYSAPPAGVTGYQIPGQPGFGGQRPLMPRPGPPLGTSGNTQGYESQEDDDDEDEDDYEDTPSNGPASSKPQASIPIFPTKQRSYANFILQKKPGSHAKHKPRKPRNEKPIDEGIDKKNAVVGEQDNSKLKINFYTRRKDGTRGEIVLNKYPHKVDFQSRESVKKLNAWRSQIISRNFNPIKKKREYWLVSERENVMKLIREQLANRSALKWAKLANDYNTNYHGHVQPAGSRLLHTQKRVRTHLPANRPTPWRTRASIEHAAAKWDELINLMAQKKADVAEGVRTDNSESFDDNASAKFSDDEVELPDPNPTPTATATATANSMTNAATPTPAAAQGGRRPRKKPPGRPMKKPIDRKRARSTSTVSDETESDHESSPEPEPKRKKPNPKGGKKGGDNDDGPTFPNLQPKKPAP